VLVCLAGMRSEANLVTQRMPRRPVKTSQTEEYIAGAQLEGACQSGRAKRLSGLRPRPCLFYFSLFVLRPEMISAMLAETTCTPCAKVQHVEFTTLLPPCFVVVLQHTCCMFKHRRIRHTHTQFNMCFMHRKHDIIVLLQHSQLEALEAQSHELNSRVLQHRSPNEHSKCRHAGRHLVSSGGLECAPFTSHWGVFGLVSPNSTSDRGFSTMFL
jgi:hypothetical protein